MPDADGGLKNSKPLACNDMGQFAAPTLALLRARRNELLAIGVRHRLLDIRVFGSVARGEAKPGSDIDLLVEPQENCSLFDLIGFEEESGALLGVNVDAHTPGDLHRLIRDDVAAQAVAL